MRVAKAMIVTALMVVAGVAHAGDSAEMVLDLRTGPRASGGDETLAFSSLWDGGADATVTIAQDGVAIAENLAGEGERAWSVPYNGTYELTHVTYTNGVAGKVETATFVVTGKAEPPEVTDVVATPSEPWDGTVSISFNVVNSPAAACPDWNQPHLSIVATDNVTGSNYVSSAAALSADTDGQLAAALTGSNGTHEVTWDFKAQGIDFVSTNVTFTVAYLRMPDWCVIDLSGGKDAAHYPVTYVSNVPTVPPVPNVPGGTFNTDAYKTTNLVMRLIGPGTFTMGDATEFDNLPHTVTLTRPFYCAVFETTQKQWELVTGDNPSWFKSDADSSMRPVEKVSWNMIRGDSSIYDWPNVKEVDPESFLGVLRLKSGLDALDFPTEAQWEYACRAGTATKYSYGNTANGDYMWYGNNSTSQTHVVGTKLPNAWGLYDMHGNVFEWCLDWYASNLDGGNDPKGSSSGSDRVLRGGGWTIYAYVCASSYRSNGSPSFENNDLGFRLVRTLSNDFESERSAEAAAGAERAGTVCAGVSPQVEIRPTYTVTVVNGSTTNTSAVVGTTVTITATTPEPGYAFVQWASNDGVDFANASAAETTFTMPAKDVTVTAVRSEILIKDLNDAGYPWTGKPVEPEIKVELKDVDIAVRRGTDYEVSYTSNTNAGTATLTVTMLPPRLGSQSAMFKILPQPVVSNVTATASDPWNGTVDFTFVTGGNWSGLPDWNKPFLSIVATDNVTGSNYVSAASALTFDTGVAEPNHHVTWNLAAQGIEFASTNVTFTVAYLTLPDYCVIDLSGGKDAESYPVTYVSNVPNVPGGITNDLYKTTNLVMRLIGPGSFTNEVSSEVEVTNAFYCAMFETTQKQWELVTGDRPSRFTNETYYATRPVEKVSWNMIRGDANTYDWPNVQGVASDSFVGVLRQKTGFDALDLPAEAQWEYACRAGTTSKYNNGGDTEGDLQALGRYRNNGGSGSSDSCATDHATAAVGSYDPNKWGLYDMHGNVWEWCLERDSSSGSYRVLRGGSWYDDAGYCTSSNRVNYDPSYGSIDYGFRLVRTLSNNFESERSAEVVAGAERAGTVCAGTASKPIRVGKDFTAADIALADYAGMYDGEGHGIGIETNAIEGLVLRYAVGEGGSPGGLAPPSGSPEGLALPFGDAPPTFTDVTNVTVWVEASAPGYIAFTTNATVTIAKRAVSLTSGSAEKVYDGTPVTCADVLVGAAGFAPGEGATFEVTGSQTHFGSSENFFTYALNDGTLAGNYDIVTSNGTLTVTKATNAWTTDPSLAGWTYGEEASEPGLGGAAFGTATVTYSAEPGDAGDYTATFTIEGTEDYDGLTFEVPFTIARATFAAGDIALADYEGVYDGEGHGIGIETNAIAGLVLRYAVGEGGSPGGLAPPSGGSPGGLALPFGDTPPTFTDVTNVTVWVEASAPNYETVTNSATVKIAPRTVTDGEAEVNLELPEGGCVGDGAAKEPAVSVLCGGRQLAAGVDYDIAYSDNVEPGTATVTVTFKGNYAGTATARFDIAEPEPQPEPEPEPPAERRVLWPTDAPFQLDRAATYNGYLIDTNADGAVVGTIRVKAGKPNRKTGASCLTATVWLTGQKAVTARGSTVDGTFRATAGGRALDIALGLHSLSGAFGSYLVDGSRDMFSARDADSKSRAAQALSRWKGNYVAAWQAAGATDAPYNTLSITVKKKGRVTVKGTLANGTRVSANTRLLVGGLHRRMDTGSMLLVGEKECAVAVSWAKKGSSVACLLWFGEDGTVSCESLNDGSVAVAAPVGAGLAAGATLRIDQAAVAAAFPGISVERSFPGGVPAKLSLRYGKDGTFGGSFKVYVDSGVSFRQKTVKVSGVVLDGVGYGVAYVKNVGDWKITVE